MSPYTAVGISANRCRLNSHTCTLEGGSCYAIDNFLCCWQFHKTGKRTSYYTGQTSHLIINGVNNELPVHPLSLLPKQKIDEKEHDSKQK